VGEGRYPVQVAIPQGFQLVEVIPAQVTVKLDSLASKQAPVAITLMGSVAGEYVTRSPSVQPTDLRVEGPASRVALVTRLVGEVDVTGATATISRSVPVRAVDASNNEIADVSIQPGVVSVMVPVIKLPPGKAVEVKPRLSGKPATGKEIGTVTVDPPTVTLRGDAAALADITSVSTQAIDISGATTTFTTEVEIVIPGAAQMAEPTLVRVTVEVVPPQGTRTFEGVPVMVTDVRTGLGATLSPTGIRVVVRGPKSQIGGLEIGDIQVHVSALDLGPGTYQLKPSIIVPAGYAVIETAPVEIAVTLAGP
ncbi:MAG: YbbR-like domain-containing protein, partial [Chloroflexota bacterium]